MKGIKKAVTGIAAFALAASCALPLASGTIAKAEESATEAKTIEMYLIAGQSNAAGYSKAGSLTEEYENIMYAGQTDKKLRSTDTVSTSSDFLTSYDKYCKKVMPGLGANSNCIGPEYGMASVFNDRYSQDNQAMIFKTAAGGTNLLNSASGLSASFGNWYPRSLWPANYTPEINVASQNNNATGILYELFVENFRSVYNTLKENGYNPVVKGMAWMQGCNDLNSVSDEYGDVLIQLIKDVRTDLVSITGDSTLQAMPFVIGKIAPTFQSYCYDKTGKARMDEMHKQQERAASELGGVATISTDDLIIVDENGKTVGTDVSHFNTKDAVTLGQRFANKILDLGGQTRVAATAENGSVKYTIETIGEGDEKVNNVKLTLESNGKRYEFTSLKVNDQDVTENVVNGEYTVENVSGIVKVEAKFTEIEKFQITYANLGKKGGFRFTYDEKYRGDTLSLKLVLNEGYTVEKVTFNGEEMTLNAETGEYEIVVTSAGKVDAVIKGGEPAADNNDSSSSSSSSVSGGCSSVVGGSAAVLTMGLCVGAAMLLKKRK